MRYDVFISYRDDSDRAIAKMLHGALTGKGLHVFWDKLCLEPGEDWENGFVNGMISSRCFVPIVSNKAIEARFAAIHSGSSVDNVLLEYRLAVELHQRGLIKKMYPVCVGDETERDVHTKYSFAWTPSVSSAAKVEAKVGEHLHRQGLGAPLSPNSSVADTLSRILKCQGGFIEGAGSLELLVGKQADKVYEMVTKLGTSH